MGKRAVCWFVLCLAMVACVMDAACTGTPPLFHQITFNPPGPLVIASGGTQLISASVANDSSGAGVTWTQPAHGTLTGITTSSATYNAPTVAAGTSVSDSVKATSATYSSESATLSITVEGAPVISTNSLPSGNQGTPYSQTVSAAGGVAPFSWSISAGALPGGLSLGASTSNSVTISGNPTAQGTFNFTIKITDSSGASGTQALSIVINAPLPLQVSTNSLPNGVLNAAYPSTTLQATGGVPPFTWAVTSGNLPTGLSLATDGTITGTPTATGTFNFTVQVTDSETPAMMANGNLSITVNNLGPLQGNYAFVFSGFNASGAVAIAGSFAADGLGNLTSGVEDFNSVVSNSYVNHTFTGTYTLGSDNRGVLTFSSLQGSPAFAFALDSTGAHGRMVEFDSSGIRGSGQLELRTVSTCTSNTLNGEYAFGITGQVISSPSSTAGPAVVVGSVPASSGSLGPGESDANLPEGVSASFPGVSGTYQATSQTTRCSMTISPLSQDIGTTTFSVYPVSSSEAFVIEIDQVSSNEPFLMSGKLFLQSGYPFVGVGGSQFTAGAVAVGGLAGQFFNGSAYVPDMALITVTGSGSVSYAISILENQAGTVGSASSSGLDFTESDQFGRLETDITPIDPVFYVINNNEALCIGDLQNQPFFGIFEPQSASPFTASQLNAQFVLGTSSPSTSAVTDISGTLTLANTSTTAGSINGNQDQSSSGGNSAGQTVTGTYSGLNSSTGAGNAALTLPTTFSGQFYVVSPTKIVMLSTTSGDADPVLLFLGNCAATCGED